MLLGVLVLMVAFFTVMNPVFFTAFAFANILQDWAPVMLLAIGETFVIITGGIDLSVGSALGLSGVACAMVMRSMHQGGADTTTTILGSIRLPRTSSGSGRSAATIPRGLPSAGTAAF